MVHVIRRAAWLALFGALSIAAAAAPASVGALGAKPSSLQAFKPDLYADLTWHCVGPFDGGPVTSVTGVSGEAGVYVITTPSGGVWKTIDGGETWASIELIDRQDVASGTSDPHRWTDPANPKRIVRTEPQGISVSLDGGQTWVPSHHLPIGEVAHITPRQHQAESVTPRRTIAGRPVNVSIVDPTRAGLIFAGTNDSVYVSFDDGVRWESLRLNLPSVSVNDLDIHGNDLVAATQGRSVWVLDDISPLRQLSAATASAAAVLFKPADAVLIKPDIKLDAGPEPSAAVANLDYYLGPSSSGRADAEGGPVGDVRLEILDASGRVVHTASSATASPTDPWLPVMRPLPAAPGHHRIVWNLRLDPPPAQHHRYAQLARRLFEDTPADPDGPQVLAGSFRVRLTVRGQVYAQPLIVHDDPRVGEAPAALVAERRQFDLAMKMYDAMQIAHRGFVQLTRVRAELRPMLTSKDPEVALAAADLDARLAGLDGSDRTGLVVPDADDASGGEIDEKDDKHPDFAPPAAVPLSKDYDDPTSILGRAFGNVNQAPAFATMSAAFGSLLTKTVRAGAAPDAAAVATYEESCQQLSGVLDAWKAANAQDLPRLNAEWATRGLPALSIAANAPTIACGSKEP
jgi:hypothetical protein